jgi:hypothetical protein
MHTALVSRLLKDRSAWELAHVPAESEPASATVESVLTGRALPSPALMSA